MGAHRMDDQLCRWWWGIRVQYREKGPSLHLLTWGGGVKTLLQIFSFVLYTGIEATVEIGKVTDFVVILLSHGKLEGPSQVEIQVWKQPLPPVWGQRFICSLLFPWWSFQRFNRVGGISSAYWKSFIWILENIPSYPTFWKGITNWYHAKPEHAVISGKFKKQLKGPL